MTPERVPVTAVTDDSRAVAPGAIFVAVSGERFDGHNFIDPALEQGAVAVVGSRDLDELAAAKFLGSTVPYVQVADAREALALCAAALHGFPSRDMTVIGVTGTDGKTTTTTILESILAAATRSAGAPAGRVGVITTVGAHIQGRTLDTGFHVTTPDAPAVQGFLAQMRDAGCSYALVESTSHGLAQRRVAAVEYDVAAVTNITHEHLDYHGSRDAYVAAKGLLFRALFATPPKPGMDRAAVLNADDQGSYQALREILAEEAASHPALADQVAVRAYGLAGEGDGLDVFARQVAYRPDRTRFQLHWWGGSFPVESRLIGDFNVYNILCAATAALSLGVEPRHIQQGIADLTGVIGRMERIDRGQDFLALVDFAHSPASLERALTTLRQLVGEGGRLIAIFGSAGLRDKAKRRLMGQVSGRLADFTVITAEDPRTENLDAINRAIATGVCEYAPEHAYAIVPDRQEAIQHAVDMARAGDVVAAFGKGHERSMCFGETEYPWSDQAALGRALDRRLGRETGRETHA
jgi:UDP-N-acetylmuramoyl-L-alanyl-D-glutamate--2,6-diaminopimelate ligase